MLIFHKVKLPEVIPSSLGELESPVNFARFELTVYHQRQRRATTNANMQRAKTQFFTTSRHFYTFSEPRV
jgi:hypothetical protein